MAGCTNDAARRDRLNDQGLPCGYANSTVVLARILTPPMAARPRGAEELRAFRRSLEPGGRRPATGCFAPRLTPLALTRRPTPRVRRARPTTTGTTMRYPSRLLTDDQRRAFARRATVHGGIVVIDQSGSMDIDVETMSTLLRRAPNALVVGYSHRPGDHGVTPNAWILANRGSVALTVTSGNIGNGVDGPRFLALARQTRERTHRLGHRRPGHRLTRSSGCPIDRECATTGATPPDPAGSRAPIDAARARAPGRRTPISPISVVWAELLGN